MKIINKKQVTIILITLAYFSSLVCIWGSKSYAESNKRPTFIADGKSMVIADGKSRVIAGGKSKVIKDTISLLKKDEGFRSSLYLDTLGNKTLGYGFKYSELDYDSTTITEQKAYEVLQIKVFNITEKLDKKKFYKGLQVKQKIAIISMVYQLGFKGFYKFKDTIEALKKHNYEKASTYAKDSLWCKQTPARCERISLMLIKEN